MRYIKTIINKYKNMDLPLKASIWAVICSFMQKGIGFISMPIFSRLLSTEEYGVYTVFFSWMNIMSVFCTLKISSGALNNGLLAFSGKKKVFLSSIIGLTFVLTLLSAVGFGIVNMMFPNLVKITNSLIPAMFVYIFFVAIVDLWAGKERFAYKYKLLTGVLLSIAVFSPILGVIAIKSVDMYKAEARIISSLIVELIVGLILTFALLKEGRYKIFEKKYWIYVLKFNVPLIPHYLSTMLLMQCDTVMISSIRGESEVGLYGIAYSIAMISTIFNTSINSSLLPYTYHSIKDENYVGVKSIIKKLVVLIGAINLFIVLLAPEILKIVASSEYQSAVGVIPPLIGSVFFMFLYTVLANIEFYYEKSSSIAVASIGAAFINICLNYILIREYGFIGAGYATLISYIVLVVLHIVNIKIINKNIIKGDLLDYRFLIIVSVVFVALCLLCAFTYNIVILKTLLAVVIGSISIWFGRKIIHKLKSK